MLFGDLFGQHDAGGWGGAAFPERGFLGLREHLRAFLVVAGVVDPTKVTRCALQNAASVAVMLLTTEAAITEEVKEEEKKG